MTPVDSSLNMLAIELLQKQTGITITFEQWICAGVPLVVVFKPVAWLIITRVYDIPALPRETLSMYAKQLALSEKLSRGAMIKNGVSDYLAAVFFTQQAGLPLFAHWLN